MEAILENVTSNVQRLARPDQFPPIELLERYQYGALLLATTMTAVVTMWKRRDRIGGPIPNPTPHVAITAATLAIALTAMLLLYQFTTYAEHRVLSAFLLFGTMLCLAAPGWIGPTLAAGIIVFNIASAPTSLIELEDAWRDRFVWDRRSVSELERALDGTVRYRPEASRWCNTLLASQYPPQFVAVPAGIRRVKMSA